jgi:hypothetical protein
LGGFGFAAEPAVGGPNDVNTAGLVAGVEKASGVLTAVLWRPSVPGSFAAGTSTRVAPTNLPALGAGSWWNTAAMAVGPTGVVGGYASVAGAAESSASHCFAWLPNTPNGDVGTTVTLDLPADVRYCRVSAVSRGTQLIGWANRPNGYRTTVRWTPGPGGGTHEWLFADDHYNQPHSANAAGQIAGSRRAAGSSQTEGYVWTPDTPDASTGTFQSLGENVIGPVLNDVGHVVFARPTAARTYEPVLRVDGVDHLLPGPAGAAWYAAYALSEPVAVSPTTTRLVVAGWATYAGPPAHATAVRWEVLLDRSAQPGTVGGAVDAVDDLVTGGALPVGTANALLGKLEAAQRQVERGQVKAARNLLTAVLNEVNALVASGRLTAAQAAPLLAAVQAAIATL